MISLNINSFAELTERISFLQQLSKTTNNSIISIEHQLRELAETIKYAEQYQSNKPFHVRYEMATNKDLIFHKYEPQIILFSGAEHILQEKGIDFHQLNPEKLKSVYQELLVKKNELSNHLTTQKSQIKEMELIHDNLKKYISMSSIDIPQKVKKNKLI